MVYLTKLGMGAMAKVADCTYNGFQGSEWRENKFTGGRNKN